MHKKYFKLFLSKESERKWLNKMGALGYLLQKKSFGIYRFKYNEGCKYFYSSEYLESPVGSEASEAYLLEKRQSGIDLLFTKHGWSYFMKTGSDIVQTSRIAKNNAGFYFWRTFYLLFSASWGAILAGYHFFAITFLERVAHQGDGLIRFTVPELESQNIVAVIVNFFVSILNLVIELLNQYLELIRDTFGTSDAIAVLALVIPVTLVLLILGAVNLESYIFYRKGAKNRR